MRERTPSEIRDKIYSGDWGERELRLVADQFSGELVFEVLYGIFTDPARLDSRFRDQQIAGRHLRAMNPPCPIELDEAISGLLSTWDLSVEEVPWYFANTFSKDAVLQALERIESGSDRDDSELRAIKTWRFWLSPSEEEVFHGA